MAQPVDTATDRRRQPERLADLSRRLQRLELQRSRPDQPQQREGPVRSPGSMSRAARRAACSRCRWSLTACCTTPARTAGSSRSNGATGAVIWSYFPELDDTLVARQTHSPYNRGVALGEGKVFVGTVDGRLIALDMKTGKVGLGHQAAGFAEAHRRLHRRAALRQGRGRDRQPGRRVARPRPDLWGRRRDRQGEVDVPHRRRQPTRRRRPGATIPGAPAAAAAGCPAPTTATRTRSIGAPPTRRRCTTGPAPTGRPRARARATTSTPPR